MEIGNGLGISTHLGLVKLENFFFQKKLQKFKSAMDSNKFFCSVSVNIIDIRCFSYISLRYGEICISSPFHIDA